MTNIVTTIISNQPVVANVTNNSTMVTFSQQSAEIVNLVGNPVALAGSADYLNFNQASASAVWTINHNFGRKPNVSVYTAGGLEVLAEIIHLTNNITQVTLDSALSGFAILS